MSHLDRLSITIITMVFFFVMILFTFNWLPSRERSHIPPGEKENHLKKALKRGYVSSQEGYWGRGYKPTCISMSVLILPTNTAPRFRTLLEISDSFQQVQRAHSWIFLMVNRKLLGGSSPDLDTWLITIVIVSPLNGVIPLVNGLNGL